MERLTILLAVAVLHVPAIAWLMGPPRPAKQRVPVAGRGKAMQLVWIPRAEPAAGLEPRTPAVAEPTAPRVASGIPPSTSQRQAPADMHMPTIAPSAAADTQAPAWDVRRDMLGIQALVRALPAQDAQAPGAKAAFSGGRDAIRLPDDGPPRVEGIVVHEDVSLDDRVQGVLALVGLGRVDPCPDIRRHLRSALAGGDPDEVQHWVNRQRACR